MATRNEARDRAQEIARVTVERARHVLDELQSRTPDAVRDFYDRTAPRVRDAYEETAPRLRDAYRRFHRSAPQPVGKALDVAEDAVGLARKRIAQRIERSAPAPEMVPPPSRDVTGKQAPMPTPSKAQLKKATKAELYEQAQELDIPGRSKMSKAELVDAIANRP